MEEIPLCVDVFNNICECYDLNKFELDKMHIFVAINDVNIENDAKVECIREFLSFRDSAPKDSDDFKNLTEILCDLCEN